MAIAPVKTKEVQVADYLREAIISGRIARGSRLKQAEIAAQLNTSITPVREALKLLEAEGYVCGDSFRGATVAPFDIEASREILNLRILLETQLVKGAVERATATEAEARIRGASIPGHARSRESSRPDLVAAQYLGRCGSRPQTALCGTGP